MGLRTSDIDIVSFILDANFICYINLFIVFIYYVSSIFEPKKNKGRRDLKISPCPWHSLQVKSPPVQHFYAFATIAD